MTRFVTVKTVFGGKVPVPTKEEYEGLIEKLMRTQADIETRYFRLVQKNISLQDRIAALEGDRNSVPTMENVADWLREAEEEYEESLDNEKTQITLMNGAGDVFELEGTKKQIEAFEAERKERNDLLFPSAMSFMKTAELALEHGLTVKKVVTRK